MAGRTPRFARPSRLISLCFAVGTLLIFPHCARAQRVSISLLDTCNIQAIEFSPTSEGYQLLVGGTTTALAKGERLRVTRTGDSLFLRTRGQLVGLTRHAAIINRNPSARFQLEIMEPHLAPRVYGGNLSLFVDFGKLMCVNLVDQDQYVAGVILAEVGPSAKLATYKAQALLVRTYLLSNLSRHIAEGYNLCDGVHCQAYKESAHRHRLAQQAAEETSGRVVLDRENHLIHAVFHANCGGETASSGDVWLEPYEYLRAVRDPYCRKSRGATWRQYVQLKDWKYILASKGVNVRRIPTNAYAYKGTHREAVYSLPGGVAVPFRDLREYFHLESSWFDIHPQGDKLLLVGRGYGHGIGLCQEGAIRMAHEGYTAEQIIAFYFKHVHIAPIEAIEREGD